VENNGGHFLGKRGKAFERQGRHGTWGGFTMGSGRRFGQKGKPTNTNQPIASCLIETTKKNTMRVDSARHCKSPRAEERRKNEKKDRKPIGKIFNECKEGES